VGSNSSTAIGSNAIDPTYYGCGRYQDSEGREGPCASPHPRLKGGFGCLPLFKVVFTSAFFAAPSQNFSKKNFTFQQQMDVPSLDWSSTSVPEILQNALPVVLKNVPMYVY
jgi:hypothetical protein